MMEVESVWQRPLHQPLNGRSVKIHEHSILFTEGLFAKGHARLSCCHIETGDYLWSTVVPDSWGWTEVFADKVYYISQSDILTVMDVGTGALLTQLVLPGRYPGYIVATEHALFTGGWRGYSDLHALDLNTFEQKWSVKVRSPDIQKFAVPLALTKEIIVLANHTKGIVELRETNSGRILAHHTISNDFDSTDLAQSCQVVDGDATFLSKFGLQLIIDAESLKFNYKQLNIQRSDTVLPLIDNKYIVIFDGTGIYKMYDRATDKVIWETRIKNNYRERTLAAFLDEGNVLFAGSMGQLKLVNEEGEQVGRTNSHRRIGTQLMRVDSFVLFGAKAEIVAVRFHRKTES